MALTQDHFHFNKDNAGYALYSPITSQSLCSLSVSFLLWFVGTSGKRFTGFCGVAMTGGGGLGPLLPSPSASSTRLSSPLGAGRMLFSHLDALMVLSEPCQEMRNKIRYVFKPETILASYAIP